METNRPEALFKFNNHQIINTSINIQPDLGNYSDDYKLDINIKSEFTETSIQKVQLEVILKNKDNSVNIAVECLGFFEFHTTFIGDKDTFINTNAPAILYPYIRAYISTISVLSGIKVINLPSINFAAKR